MPQAAVVVDSILAELAVHLLVEMVLVLQMVSMFEWLLLEL
jgi:hypothetical protein